MIEPGDIQRVTLGHYTMPEESSLPHQKIVVLAYLIRHPDALVLFDTGIGEGHAEAERRYHPIVRRPLREVPIADWMDALYDLQDTLMLTVEDDID